MLSLLELLHLEGLDPLELIPQDLLLHGLLVPAVSYSPLELLHIRRVKVLGLSLLHVGWPVQHAQGSPSILGEPIVLSSHTRQARQQEQAAEG